MRNRNPNLPKSRLYAGSGPGDNSSFLMEPVRRRPWEIGVVVDVSPVTYTYAVSLAQHGVVHDVRRILTSPGETELLPRGTEVVVSYEIDDAPLIIGTLPSRRTGGEEVNPARISEVPGIGGEDGVTLTNPDAMRGKNARPPNAPVDVVEGDWVKRNHDSNNFVSVLAGGVNVMQSSPVAQVRTNGPLSMVETIAWVYRHISALGNLEILNEGGKTSLVWRAGADQSTETGAHMSNWTLRLDAGAKGDLFRLQVTTPEGKTLSEIHLGADGKLSFVGAGGVDILAGIAEGQVETVGGDAFKEVYGEEKRTVHGDDTHRVSGDRDTFVNGNAWDNVGGNREEAVTGNAFDTISGRMVTSIDGGSADGVSQGNVASRRELINGGEEVLLGNPARQADKTVEPDYKVLNFGGNIYISVTKGKKVVILNDTDDGVLLGADGSINGKDDGTHEVSNPTAKHHVSMYEELKEFLDALIDWLDNHTHLTAYGPSGPGQTGTYGPASAKLKSKIDPIKSRRAAVGA